MSKKSTTLKRPSTRSLSTPKASPKDKYTFQSDDEDHQSKPTLLRKTSTPTLSSKRPRGRPPKSTTRTSTSSASDSEEKKIKINSTPPILITPKKRGRKPKMLATTTNETENLNPSSPSKPRANEQDDFSDDSVDFVWKGSSKMSIEILKRRIPKDESRDFPSSQSDPTAQRKRAIIPRLTNFENLSGQPVDNAADERAAKKPSSVITLNNAFQNDFDYSYNDKGAKMPTTGSTEEKPRPRVYAVKSTTSKPRSHQEAAGDIKRPKWMNDQEENDEEEQPIPALADEPNDYDYTPKGNYIPKRPSYRGRGSYPGRRGRPPGSRRNWNNDDDDDDYDQYEEANSRYGQRKSNNYRTNRYDMADDDEYDKTPRMSLTQAYRRPNDIRQQPTINRRVGINNGNHPAYKEDEYYQQQQQQSRPSNSSNRLPTTNATSINTGNTFVAKINDAQLSEVANQSQIFFVNMPQQDQKNQQVLSVLASEQQQVLPVAVVQQAKVETPSTTNSSTQNQTLAFTVKLPVDTPKQKKILPKPSANSSQSSSNASSTTSKPFAWSRPPGRIQLTNEEQNTGKGLTITPINTDLDTMEAAHVLATAADVTMANEARRKAQQNDDEMAMMDETPSNIVNEETVQCEDEGQKNAGQAMGTITANIIDENGLEHTVLLSTEEAQQLLGSQGAIIVDGDGQPISLQQTQTQTFLSPFALDQAQLQAILAQAGLDPNTPLTIEQIDPNQQQQQVATLCTSPGGTQYTVLTQAPAQQQFILQTTTEPAVAAPPVQPQLIAPKEDPSSPPKRRAFAVKSTLPTSEAYEDMNERPRRKIFATKSTVSSME